MKLGTELYEKDVEQLGSCLKLRDKVLEIGRKYVTIILIVQ
jgi:hypothetical protein